MKISKQTFNIFFIHGMYFALKNLEFGTYSQHIISHHWKVQFQALELDHQEKNICLRHLTPHLGTRL
jgi:hypothetical protein